MKNKILILLLSIAPATLVAQSGDATVSTAVPFLTIAPDARAAALGNTGVATSADVNAQYWNAAKYVFGTAKAGVGLNYAPLQENFGDTYNAYISGYFKLDTLQSISASFRYFSYGEDITYTDENNLPLLTHKPNDLAIDIAYARRFGDYFGAAVTFRYIRSDIAPSAAGYKTGQAVAADIATYYRRPVNLFGQNFSAGLGAAVSNIGSKISYADNGTSENLPLNLRVGGALTYHITKEHDLGLSLDFNKLLLVKNNGLLTSVGLEYTYEKLFSARAGYCAQSVGKGAESFFAAGAGIIYKMVTLDVSYLVPTQNSSLLSNTIRLSLAVNF